MGDDDEAREHHLLAVRRAYAAHADALHRVAVAQLYDAGLREEAEDIVANAILEVLESPPADEVQNWEAYLVTIVKRRAIDFARSARVRHRADEEFDHDTRSDGRLDIEDAGEGMDTIRLLERAVDALNGLEPRLRQLAHGCLWAGRTQKQMSTELGLSQPQVNALLAKAREQIIRKITRGEG